MEETRKLTNKVELHLDWENWTEFLKEHCEFRTEFNGFKLYNAVNCWYAVDSNGIVYPSYGYHVLSSFTKLSGIDIFEFRNILGWDI